MATSGTAIWFRNENDQRLSGVLHGEPTPYAVIACHGMLSNKESDKISHLVEHLESVRMPSLRFDFAGRGESDGYLLDLNITGQKQDLKAALDELERRGAKKIAVFGSSLGGTVALETAAEDSRIHAVATVGAVGHPDRIEEMWPEAAAEWRSTGQLQTEVGPVGEGFLLDALHHSTGELVEAVQVPTMITHGDADEVVPVSDAHDLHRAIGGSRLEIVEGADHRISDDTVQRDTMHQIGRFLVAELRRR